MLINVRINQVVRSHDYSFEEFIIADKCNGIGEVIRGTTVSDHLKAGKDWRPL